MEVTELSLNSSTETSVIARIRLKIPNPSAIELRPVGRLVLRVLFRNVVLGLFEVEAWEAVRRGCNEVWASGKLEPLQEDLACASELFSALLGNGHVSLLATLASADNPVLATALEGVILNTSILAPPLPLLAPAGVEIVSCSLMPVSASGVGEHSSQLAFWLSSLALSGRDSMGPRKLDSSIKVMDAAEGHDTAAASGEG